MTEPDATASVTAPPAGGRIDLGDGDWAEVAERPTHGQINQLYKAYVASQKDPALYIDLMSAAILALTTSWSIRLPSGDNAPLSAEGVAATPWDKLKPVFEAAMAIFGDTKVTAGPNA